ncbi:MAG: DUF805 domain-containing protein [Pseudomonadota bacterium]|nr:DUF805 domain-containing protein [Pseudomonadota bacterium]
MSPQGRVNRATFYFAPVVVLVLCGLVTNGFVLVLGDSPSSGVGGRITFFGTLALAFWPFVALTVKRTHDLGFSGWFALLTFVPYAGWLPTLALLFVRGPQRPVRYWPFRALHV